MAKREANTGLSVAFAIAAAAGVTEQAKAAEAILRVVDVGNAMCVIASVPGGHFMLYDAGNFGSEECENAVREIVGTNELDLLVLSHSDEDHIGELAEILVGTPATAGRPAVPGVRADLIVYTGAEGTSSRTWPGVRDALADAERARPGSVRNLGLTPLPNTRRPAPGQTRAAPLQVPLGAATATFVSGWNIWSLPGDRGASPSASERRNAISIVVRFEFGGKSVLLTGDVIGRRGRENEPDDACRDVEQWMVRLGNAPLDSDVLVGQHHGGDNSSSHCFIEAVSPEFVVFPAGRSSHDHPRARAVNRYFSTTLPVNLRVAPSNIFRTDRGDDEGIDEWDGGRQAGCEDKRGDDDIEIVLSDVPGTRPVVRYRNAVRPCP